MLRSCRRVRLHRGPPRNLRPFPGEKSSKQKTKPRSHERRAELETRVKKQTLPGRRAVGGRRGAGRDPGTAARAGRALSAWGGCRGAERPCAECGAAGGSGAGCRAALPCSAGTHGSVPAAAAWSSVQSKERGVGGGVTRDKGGEDGGSGGGEENAAALPERGLGQGQRGSSSRAMQLVLRAGGRRCGEAWMCDCKRKRGQSGTVWDAQLPATAPCPAVLQRGPRETTAARRQRRPCDVLRFPCKRLLPPHPGAELTQAARCRALQPTAGLVCEQGVNGRQPRLHTASPTAQPFHTVNNGRLGSGP